MNLFERLRHELTGQSLMLEMATITTPTNQIPNYAMVNIIVNPSSHLTTRGARQEHDPPHFHLTADGFDVSISLPDYELIAVRFNRNKRLLIKNEKSLSWQTSGQLSLRKALLDWISKEFRAITNEQRVFTMWNESNPTLSTAFYNFEQTRKHINKLIIKTKSKLDRDDLQEIALEHSFINRETLMQVFDSLGMIL